MKCLNSIYTNYGILVFVGICLFVDSHGLLAHGDIHESIDRITQEIKAHPDSSKLYIRRGQYFVIDENYDKAYIDYKIAQNLDKSESIVDLLLGKLFYHQSLFHAGLFHVEKYLKNNSNSVDGLVTRAGIFVQIDSAHLATKDLQKAIGILEYPEPIHFILIADAVYNSNEVNYIEAKKWMKIGEEKMGFNVVLKEKEIKLAILTKNYDDAVVVINDIIGHFERKEKWLFRLGEIYEMKNEIDNAISYYHETINTINELKPRIRNTKKMRAIKLSSNQRIEALVLK